MALKEVDVKRR